jgi:pimeloyl-ACP methyl ester carboxylesterase
VTRGRLLLGLAVAAVGHAVPAGAEAGGLRFRDCGGIDCGRLSVPLDRSGGDERRISLYVERRRALRGPRRGATLLLAGGPGESATFAYDSGEGVARRYAEWSPLTPHNDIVVFDQRGTGRSGPLRCRELEQASSLDAGREAEACAVVLGRKRAFYRTTDSVDDIEALRRGLGVRRLTIVGVSYGTYVAQAYALRYPGRVERMALDSVVDVTGVDALYGDSWIATPRILRALCRVGCRRFTRDPVADVERLVAGMASGPLRGFVVRPSGRRRRVALTRQGLAFTLAAGDVDEVLRAAFPGAVVSALRGDPAPILRLKRRAVQLEGSGRAREFSDAVLAATYCEETRFPWPRFAPVAERPDWAYAAASLIPLEQLRPFDSATVAGNDLIRLCRRWPTLSPELAPDPGPPPDVPVLLLAGEVDGRTPVETARKAAARYLRSRLFVAPDTGHSVEVSDLSGCSARVLQRFLRRRPLPTRCPRGRPPFPATRPLPASLRALSPLRGVPGVRGRVLRAVELTVADAAEELDTRLLVADDKSLLFRGFLRGPGLRGGRFEIDIFDFSAKLEGLELVPGVGVSGAIRDIGGRRERGRLRVSGPATPDGRLRLRRGRLSGRLGGRRVDSATPEGATAAAAAATPTRLHDRARRRADRIRLTLRRR